MNGRSADRESTSLRGVYLLDFLTILIRRRRLILPGVLASVLLAGLVSRLLPPIFTASAKFLPSKNPDMISRMGTLVGGGKLEGYEDNVTSEYYIDLLKSTTFLARIAPKKFTSREKGGDVDLTAYYNIEGGEDTQKTIKTVLAISREFSLSLDRKTKVITLRYSTREPELSAAIVNAFLEELKVFNQDVRDFKAKRNREFIEKQLEDNQILLNKAESALAEFTARNKKIVTPELEVDKDRLKRNVDVQTEVFITLKKQLELAKIEEQEKKPSIEVIDSPTVPLTKSKPRTVRNMILAFFGGLFFFGVLAFLLDFLGRLNPDDRRHREFLESLDDVKKDGFRVLRLFGWGREKKGNRHRDKTTP